MSVVYLYHYKLPVQLSQTDHGAPNLSRPMYNYHIKLYKNNHNRVDFVIRNNDKKPVKLLDCVIQVTIQHVESGQTYLQKMAEVTDEIRGRAQLYVSPTECAGWPLGGYQFTVQLRKPGYQDEFLFVDVNNHVQGEFELLETLGSELIPAQEIVATQFTPQIVDWDTQQQVYRTGALPARNPVGQHAGFYSLAIYTQSWRGRFRVEASLQNLAPTDDSWFTVPVQGAADVMIMPNSAPVIPINFGVNARWIRFTYEPHVDNLGQFVKVLYKIS
jgi:hypothetical protein